jgi:microcystin-dependent protein
VVLPFGGTYDESLLGPGGWLLCDGRLLTTSAYQALFNAIGTANGGTGPQFNLPDYRGAFLRDCDDGARLDPDRDARTAVADGAATGDHVGSFQGFATAQPAGGLTVTVAHLPQDFHHAHETGIKKFDAADYERLGEVEVSSSANGGDSESRPQNIYFDYIIQSLDDKLKVTLPVGTLVAMTPVQVPQGWMLCDGASLNKKEYPELFTAIGTSHGGTGDPNFNLPDLRGRFLRGHTGSSTNDRDPDAAQRTSAATDGNTGNEVGSLQEDATARPVDAFKTRLSHCPQEKKRIRGIAGKSVAKWNSDSEPVTFTGKWDNETRPVNLYVDWYIKVIPKATLPIGSIVAVAGDESPGDNFLRCDGKSYRVEKDGIIGAAYPELFAAIGTLNGGDGSSNFNVPDCRSRFLRGVDRGCNRDPDASTRTAPASGAQSGDNPGSIQGFATGQPDTDITGNADHLPTNSHDTGASAVGVKAAAWTGNSTTTEVRGGDKETRPVNIYVRYYIKAKD